jgi:mannose-6-phosphate isomerase-like protein (cupin superfamily)
MDTIFEFKTLGDKPDYLAPDTSEIRLLPFFNKGGLCHCLLPIGGVTKAVKHKTVDEIWYCLSGKGIIWQKNSSMETEHEFSVGNSFTIPCGNSFQFKNIGSEPLCILISTMPKWPGAEEALPSSGKWDT